MIKPIYIRYFEDCLAYYVCRDVGHVCEKITGPWATIEVAQLSLEIQVLN